MYGAVKAGKVPFLIDDKLSRTEIGAIARDVQLDVLLVATEWEFDLPRIGEWQGLQLYAFPAADKTNLLHPSTAVCRFTSGTSSAPKCLEFSHTAVLEAGRVWMRSNRMESSDITLCLAGFFNGLAFNTSLAATFLSGAQLVIYSGWASPPQVLREAARHHVTRLIGFPAFYKLLASSGLARNKLPASLQQVYSAASSLSDDTRNALKAQYGLDVSNYYGIAEAGPVTTEADLAAACGNGTALQGCLMRTENGVLQVRTPYLATRYLNRPGELEKRLTADGFYVTSDLAVISEGRLFLRGRRDAILDVGGKKFESSEVVGALLSLPGVDEAFVFGDPVPDQGMAVCAVVAGQNLPDEAVIRRQLGCQLAAFKIPQKIQFASALPRNAAGKIDAVGLRSRFRNRRFQNA
ncbi:hypothetical protein AB838_06215 [Rhodobacteraceae bacterium (ex Bugula neritina AB1)]|nr:hypothetical protein AB838_06215 [Rhodobacteraceae bacterium (ex Bugula neritina AB1)]